MEILVTVVWKSVCGGGIYGTRGFTVKACARTACESICGVVILTLYITAALTGITSTHASEQHGQSLTASKKT